MIIYINYRMKKHNINITSEGIMSQQIIIDNMFKL